MALNPNWPVIEDCWAPFWNCNGGDSPLDHYVEVTDLTRGSNGISRGRQYELDQVRAGEYSVALANTTGNLDPTNTAGPWFGHILPYQPYRKRAQWPPTINLLSQVQATGGDLGGFPLGAINAGNAGPSIFTQTDPATGQIVASGTAWQGSNVLQFSVPSTIAAPTYICYTPQPGVVPGQTYTVQLRVRNITPGTSVQVAAAFQTNTAANVLILRDVGSTATLTGSATAAWTLVTVTSTAGANAGTLYTGLRAIAAPGTTCSVQVDGWQLEKGSSASTWVASNPWYPMFAGFVERWPSQWAMGGTYGTTSPTAVDAFALLSQKILSDPLTEEINKNNPRFLYKLDDPQGSLQATDSTGAYPAVQLGRSKYGAGSFAFGTAITAANPTTGVYTGSTGTVATLTNPSPGVNTFGPSTYLSLDGAGVTGPASPTTAWSRMIAFRYTGPTPSYSAFLWTSYDKQRAGGLPSGSTCVLSIDSTGKVALNISGPGGSGTVLAPSPNVVDANWHLVIVTYSRASGLFTVNLDGVGTSWALGTSYEPTGLASDNVGTFVDMQIGRYTTGNFAGDISFVAEFPTMLSGADCTNLYSAWKTSCAGESTDARYRRILRYSGYIGPSSIQTGLTTSMGPAKIDGQDAVSALQAVVTTEGGEHFVDRAGTVTFISRAARYNATTPVYTFGENLGGGEWPYEDANLDYDPTRLGNQVTVTQESTGQTFPAQDATSIKNYFPRTLGRTINSSSALECQDAAWYLLSRYKDPDIRVSNIKLHPSAMPAMWPVCLSFELGMRVRVVRRPPAPAPAITVECFIEQIQWSMDDKGNAVCTLQCSPADTTPYAAFAAWHTTLKTSVLSGVTSIVVNPSQDTTNLLAQQLAAGQQIVLGQGTANQETVTVSAVGATSPGWTSATITLTGATTKAHTAGDAICGVLPAGTTDPTTWDALAALDAVAFSY